MTIRDGAEHLNRNYSTVQAHAAGKFSASSLTKKPAAQLCEAIIHACSVQGLSAARRLRAGLVRIRSNSCMLSKTKQKFRLIFGTVILLVGTASICAAAGADGLVSDPVSDYLHANRLPLVEARTNVTASGERAELLYGYVATDVGKLDAEEQTQHFIDDPDIPIIDRIVVQPELYSDFFVPVQKPRSATGVHGSSRRAPRSTSIIAWKPFTFAAACNRSLRFSHLPIPPGASER